MSNPKGQGSPAVDLAMLHRSVTMEIVSLVPDKGMLPICHGLLGDGKSRCDFHAKYAMNGRPMCGVHLRPGAMFFPERLIRE